MKHRRLLISLVLLIFFALVIAPFTMGLTIAWASHVGLLDADAVIIPSNAPAIDRYMANVLGRAYGDRLQVCDGTGDQVEINAAISGISSTNGEVAMRAGTLYLSASIQLTNSAGYSYLTLSGDGDGTVLATSAGDPLGDHFIKSAAETQRHMFLTFKDFRILGTNQTAGDGIHTFGASYSKYQNLTVRYCFDNGIYLNSDGTYTCVDQFITKCVVTNCGDDGVYAASNTTDVTVNGCSVYSNGDDGIDLEGGGCIITDNRIYSNTGDGVYTNGKWTTINSNYFGTNGRAVALAGNGDDCVVNNNIIKAQTTGDVLLSAGATDSQVTNNYFTGTAPYTVSNGGTNTLIDGNLGYIARGELRTYAITITAGAEDTVTYWQNPFPQNVWVTEVTLNLTTAASASNPTYDIKLDADGAGVPDGTAFLDAVPDTAGTYWSWNNVYVAIASGVQTGYLQLASNTGASDWIGLCVEDAAGADSAGVFYVTIMGQ